MILILHMALPFPPPILTLVEGEGVVYANPSRICPCRPKTISFAVILMGKKYREYGGGGKVGRQK